MNFKYYPYRLSIVLAFSLLGGGATAGSTLPSFDRVRVFEEPRTITSVDLRDQDNQTFGLEKLRGNVVLVFFGFTNCPDVCPLTMANWRRLETAELVNLDDVEFVMISVDGDRDTPPVMKKFLEGFSSKIIGLTGPPDSVRALSDQFSAAFFAGNPTAHSDHYNVSHSPQSFLLDRDGDLRAELFDPSIENLAGIISALLNEPASNESENPE